MGACRSARRCEGGPAARQVNPASPIIDFYPKDFKVDMNGKKMAWMGVALLPFIDERRLLDAVRPLEATLTEQERAQNARGTDLLFLSARDAHKALASLLAGARDGGDFALEASERTETGGGGHLNDNLFGSAGPCSGAWPLFGSVPAPCARLEPIRGNLALCCRYALPPFVEHVPRLLRGLVPPDPVLTDADAIVEGRRLLEQALADRGVNLPARAEPGADPAEGGR